MLAESLESMLTNVNSISKQITSWTDKKREFRDYYADKLSYQDVKKLQITKVDLCSIFTNPQTNQPPPITCKRFPIHWCNNQAIRDNFGQRWWMVFDHPPCNNNEVPQYFLRKLYSEFVLNKVPNYFDMRDFQGRGGGSAQDRPGARLDPQRVVRRVISRPAHEHVSIPSIVKESVEVDTLRSISALTQSIIEHADPATQSGLGDSARSRVPPHTCQACGSACGYDPMDSQDAGAQATSAAEQMVMTDTLLSETFGLDTQVNISKFIEFNLLNFIFEIQD